MRWWYCHPPYWAYNEAYIEVTETCNTSYERKFCGLFDFVWFQKVRLLIKSLDRSKWDPADFGKWALPRYWWIWDYCPQYGSCLGQWQSICQQYNFSILKIVLRVEQRSYGKNPCFWNKIRSNANLPLNNELIWDFWGHIGLKQPRN